jgi:hypothetical protein
MKEGSQNPRPEGQPRPRQDLDQLRRAAEPHDADGDASRTPAMAAGIADHIWSLTEIAELID